MLHPTSVITTLLFNVSGSRAEALEKMLYEKALWVQNRDNTNSIIYDDNVYPKQVL